MSNLTTTNWIDEKNTNFDEVRSRLLSAHSNDLSETSLNYINWRVEQVFDVDKEDTFNGKIVKYNYFSYSFEQFTGGIEDDIVKKTGFIIVYFYQDKIRYIVNKNSGALTLLRKLLSYSGKSEITKSPINFSSDVFVWLISKVYNCENMLASESDELDNLSVDSVYGFKGDTDDLLTKVSAVGESVMNIISTLSFLLESNNLNQIKLNIAYREHKNIDMSLNVKNTISSDIERYQGVLTETCTQKEKVAIVFILLYTEILPIINLSYKSEIANEQWGTDNCINFLKKVAEDLSKKVTKCIDELTPQTANIDTKKELAKAE